MPLKSKAQARKLFALEDKGELPKGTAKRWAHHTPGGIKRLPEHARKKKNSRPMGKKKAAVTGTLVPASLLEMPESTSARCMQSGDKMGNSSRKSAFEVNLSGNSPISLHDVAAVLSLARVSSGNFADSGKRAHACQDGRHVAMILLKYCPTGIYEKSGMLPAVAVPLGGAPPMSPSDGAAPPMIDQRQATPILGAEAPMEGMGVPGNAFSQRPMNNIFASLRPPIVRPSISVITSSSRAAGVFLFLPLLAELRFDVLVCKSASWTIGTI